MDCVWSLLTATDGCHAWIWDIDQQKTITLQDQVSLTSSKSSKFQVMDFSYDGSLLASCINSKASLFLSKIDRDNISTVEKSTKHCFTAVKFLRKTNRFLALGSSNSKAFLYDLKAKSYKFDFSGFGCGNRSDITALESDFNDQHIASGDSNGNIAFHSCVNGTSSPLFSHPKDMAITNLKFSSMKKHLLVSGHNSGAINMSDIAAKKTVRAFINAHSSPVVSLFSPSLVTSPIIISIGLDKKMVFYDVNTSKITQSHQFTHHVISCDLNLCERILAIGTNDGSVKFYDIRNFSKCFKEISTFINTPILKLNFLKLEQDSIQAKNRVIMAPTLEPQYIMQVSEDNAMNRKSGNNIKRSCFDMSYDSDGLYSPIRVDTSHSRSVSRSKSVDDLSDSSLNKSSPNLSPRSSLRSSFINSLNIPASSPKVSTPKQSMDNTNSSIQMVDYKSSNVQIIDNTSSNVQIMNTTNAKGLNPNFPICNNMDEQTYWSKMKSLIVEVMKESRQTGSVSTCVNLSDSFRDEKRNDSVFPKAIAPRDNPASTQAILEQTQVTSIIQAIENVSTSIDQLRHLVWTLHTGLIRCMDQNKSECIAHLDKLYSEMKNDIVNNPRARDGPKKCKYCDYEYTPGI